jgi:hypothetical protein
VAAFFQVLQPVLGFLLPIAGFYAVRRRPGHTRAQLIAGAALGGGLSGALIAAISTLGGASFVDTLPWALIGLLSGAIIGLAGVAAFALGGWLNHRP